MGFSENFLDISDKTIGNHMNKNQEKEGNNKKIEIKKIYLGSNFILDFTFDISLETRLMANELDRH